MIIDGKKIAQKIERQLTEKLKKLKTEPSLAIILIGKNSASEIYVQEKQEVCQRLNIKCLIFKLPISVTQNQLLALIDGFNEDKKVNGILVQLPLPDQININAVFCSISPEKDVDGLNPLNIGFLEIGQPFIIPPTAVAVLEIMKSYKIKLKGSKVVLVGYSNLVGKPLLPLLIEQGATVTICHKKTKNLAKITKEADILVVAVGKPNLIKAAMIKKGAIIIDVGINRVGKKIIGDVDFEKVKKKASFITPVPGGVGPITVMMLLRNLIEITRLQKE